MTQTEIIDQIVYSYGQLAGKRDTIQDWLGEVVREVEQHTLPPYMDEELTVTMSGAVTHSMSGVATVTAVLHDGGNSVVYGVADQHLDRLWSGISSCLYWKQTITPTGVTITFNAAPTDDVIFRVKQFTSLPTDPDTDVPELDYIAPTVLKGLHVKSCMIVKDMDRLKAYEAAYLGALGLLPQSGEK